MPERLNAPDQSPIPFEAVQPVEFVADHVIVDVPPLGIVVGSAEMVTSAGNGAAVTITVVLAVEVPPAPVQLSKNDVVAVRFPVDTPDPPVLDRLPVHPPLEVQVVASLTVHANVVLVPEVI